MVRYADMIRESVVDGLGVRVVVFFQGCNNSCQDCQNPDLQSLEGGKELTEEDLADMVLEVLTPAHRGVTFSGGEPMLQADSLPGIISRIKAQKPHLDFWLYTGFLFEEVSSHPVMSLLDVVVDGPFLPDKRDASCQFYGSCNQRIIDVQQTLSLGKIIELEPINALG